MPDDYTATQMNIDLYSMDEQGNSKAETERRDRRRRQKEEKGEPVVEEELDERTPCYKVEFKAGGMEYEYEVDAATGTILKAESEYDD